jgi:hypothetical protein
LVDGVARVVAWETRPHFTVPLCVDGCTQLLKEGASKPDSTLIRRMVWLEEFSEHCDILG